MREGGTSVQFGLSLVAVNIVLGDLGWNAPEPFHVPHPARDDAEHARLREAVHRDLERRGLMRRGRLDGDVEAALGVLVSSPIALVFVGSLDDGQPIFARIAATDRYALQAVQLDQAIVFTEIRRAALAPAAVRLLPGGVPAAMGSSIRVQITAPKPKHRSDEPFENTLSVRAKPHSPADAGKRALERLQVKPRLRLGAIMASVSETPAGGGRLREVRRENLTWFDTEDGRYLMVPSTAHDGTEWLTVTPADGARIAQHLDGWIDR